MTDVLLDREIGPLTILFGKDNGKYPDGNSLLVRGQNKSAIIDPCLGVVARKDNLPDVDMLFFTHIHEDHVSGMHLFPDIPCYVHERDALGLESMEGFLQIFGVEDKIAGEFEKNLWDTFHYETRDEIHRFKDGQRFDLGGVQLEVLHTPGHTQGHCCFIIEWADDTVKGGKRKFVVLGDIELTGFGPYYGDAWSSLEEFESSLERIKHVDAELWLTFHHKGLIESRPEFLTILEAFSGMIGFRENNLLEYLAEPRTIEEIVEHRFVFRPGTGGILADGVEKRSMLMHLDRLEQRGQVEQIKEQYKRV